MNKLFLMTFLLAFSIESQVLHGFSTKNTPQGLRYYYTIENNNTYTVRNITVYFSDSYVGYKNKAVQLDSILPGQVSTYGFSTNDLPLGPQSVAVFTHSKVSIYDYPPPINNRYYSSTPQGNIPDYTSGLESVDQFLNQPHIKETIKQNQNATINTEKNEAYLKKLLEDNERRALRNIPKY